MVLIGLIILSLMSNDPSKRYQKQIDKQIKKVLSLESGYNVDSIEATDLQVVKSYGKDIAYLLVTEVAACHLGGCVSPLQLETMKNSGLGSEYFDALILIDLDHRILKIKILDYFSDYGYEINSKRYLKRFEGKQVCEFSAKTDGIDAISGATISSMALESVIGNLCQI